MAKKLNPNISSEKQHTPKSALSGTILSYDEKVPLHKLRPNPKNAQYFTPETEEYFARLEQDIRERGILVPLMAKEDGTLLAGHNRLLIAEKIKLPYVPVNYVKQEITEQEEQAFVIKDNLFRRQFSGAEWLQIYRKLYPNFDERIAESKAGNPKAGTLTAKVIAEDTGQKYETVKKQRLRNKNANAANRDIVPIEKSKAPEPKKGYTVPLLKTASKKDEKAFSNKREALQSLETVRTVFPFLAEKEKKEVVRTLEKLVKTLKEENYLVTI
jgi:ParB-like chromosome segregation protein Spo0J